MGAFTIDDIFQNTKKSGAGTVKKEPKARLQYIHYSELKDSEDEFYSLKSDDISRLAHSIILCGGIKQPITCRKTAPNEYEIISGHKRHAAIAYLSKQGYEEYEKMPCIVEDYASDNVRQAELILTNYTQRERTSFEKMKEVERLEQILKDMEESGELEQIWKDKNPSGKEEYQKMTAMGMREFIADALGISKTQVANLKSISNNLSEKAMGKFASGELSVSAATQLAGMEQDKQDEMVENDNIAIKDLKQEKKICRKEKEMLRNTMLNFGKDKVKKAMFLHILHNESNCTEKVPDMRHLLIPNGYSSFAYTDIRGTMAHKGVNFCVRCYESRKLTWAAFIKLLVEMDKEDYFKDLLPTKQKESAPVQSTVNEQEQQLPGQMHVENYPELLPEDYEKQSEQESKMSESDIDETTDKEDYYLFDYSMDAYFEKMEKGDICHFTECTSGIMTGHWKEGHIIKLKSASLQRSFNVMITYIEDGITNMALGRPPMNKQPGALYYRIISFKKVD